MLKYRLLTDILLRKMIKSYIGIQDYHRLTQ